MSSTPRRQHLTLAGGADPEVIHKLLTSAFAEQVRFCAPEPQYSALARCRDYGLGALTHGYGERHWQR